MSSTLKKMTVILLLTAFLAPGLAQARDWAWESATVSRDTEVGFFGMVWNLLTSMFEKNGGMLDPNGGPAPVDGTGDDTSTTTTTTTGGGGENGGMLDPNGGR
ncbi:MAG TPA: hypothetical protein VF789_28745 [Thermoanaerobaculia bacterium]